MSSAELDPEVAKIFEDPSFYREVFKLNENKDIFEILRREIVEYALENSSFKAYLLERLSPRETSTKQISYSNRIRSSMFSPRSSSRPSLN